jgi:hypothetical protein
MGTVSKKKHETTSASLTPAQLRHIPRPRGNFLPPLETMIALYRENPRELYLDGVTAADIESELAEYKAMLAAERGKESELATMRAARFQRGSHLWTTLLGLYARARIVSRVDLVMSRGIASVVQFMRPRHKRAVRST